MSESPVSPRRRERFDAPISASEVAATRQATYRANVLPPRVFHDRSIFDYEMDNWYAGGWVSVGREENALAPGQYFLASVAGENMIVVRGNDGVLRAFYNVCRHRGAVIVEEACGTAPRFQCPYHAWIYDLDGKLRQPRHTELLEGFDPGEWGLIEARCGVWQGIVYLDLSGDAPALETFLGDVVPNFARFDLGALREAGHFDYDVAANWKALIENYEECYHCPGVHPQLNKITPYNMGEYLPWNGPFIGSYMEVLPEYETLSLSGEAAGRPAIPGMTDEDEKRVYYFAIWPNQLLSLHPDYLMLHWLTPMAPDRTLVRCAWFFDPAEMAKDSFDPSDAIEFWDMTNRQDWHVCELQQQGTRSRAYTAGRYSAIESSVHGFDLMVADRYANDGVITPQHRIAKQASDAALKDRAKSMAKSRAAD
jgi:Rieske 2Fe-2S family protein